MGRSSDAGDPMPPRENWEEYAERVLVMLGETKEQREENLMKAMESLDESLTVARNIHRKTSHMEVARDFYKFALNMNNTKKSPTCSSDKKLPTLPGTSTSSSKKSSQNTPPSSQRSKRDGRGRFLPSGEFQEQHDTPAATTTPEFQFLDAHNDFCQVCEYGGELICCATCNLVFHLECLRPKLLKLPSDNWSCPYCISSGSLGHKRGSIVRTKAMSGVRAMDSETFKESRRQMKAPIAAQIVAAAAAAAVNSEEEDEKKQQQHQESDRIKEGANNTSAEGTIEEGRRSRIRHPNKRYDPQFGPASKWQSDETYGWIVASSIKAAAKNESTTVAATPKASKQRIYYEEEENCKFCHGVATVPVCCFCACRVCFRKKDKDVLRCSHCRGKYHTACLMPSESNAFGDEDAEQSWSCPDCVANDFVGEPSETTYLKNDSEEDTESQESSRIQLSEREEVSSDGDVELQSDAAVPDRKRPGRPFKQSFDNLSGEPILKKKRGRPPKAKTESFIDNNNEDGKDSLPSNYESFDITSSPKAKRGRPFKKSASEDNESQLSDHCSDQNDSSSPLKKREQTFKKGSEQDSDESLLLNNNDGISGSTITKKRGRGRPPKNQRISLTASSIDDEGASNLEMDETLNSSKKKRGRPPKSDIDNGEAQNAAAEDELLEQHTLGKRKRGRPPKLRNNDSITEQSPKRKRGRPSKHPNSSPCSPIGKKQYGIKNDTNDGRKKILPLKDDDSAISINDGESQLSYFSNSKSSTYNGSGASTTTGGGQGQSSYTRLGRLSSNANKPNALFYDDRLLDNNDDFSQMSNATATKSSDSATTDGIQAHRLPIRKKGSLLAPPIRRSGRPSKPNSLLYELEEGEQHLRSARYAAEQELKREQMRKINLSGLNSGVQASLASTFPSAAVGILSVENLQRTDEAPPYHPGLSPNFSTDVDQGFTSASASFDMGFAASDDPSSIFNTSTPAEGEHRTLYDACLEKESCDAEPRTFELGQVAASTSINISATAPIADSRTSSSSKQQHAKTPVQIHIDMGLQYRSNFEDHSSNVVAGTSSAKQPRRKPGARECMQISRRFHTQVIPSRYMEVLLDYVNRGKIEHLVRMRERLDEHSRMLESQLAGLEALVRKKGEYNATQPEGSTGDSSTL